MLNILRVLKDFKKKTIFIVEEFNINIKRYGLCNFNGIMRVRTPAFIFNIIKLYVFKIFTMLSLMKSICQHAHTKFTVMYKKKYVQKYIQRHRVRRALYQSEF